MKRMLMLMFVVFFVSVSVYANEISGEQAKKAVSFWVNSITNGATLISSRDVECVETATNEMRNLFHLVKMKGGGTIITSADSRISPIIAYSRNESLNVTNDNPLLKIVRHDMENRLSVIEKTESQLGMRMLSFSVTSRGNNNATTSLDSEVCKSISESQNAWAAFLNEPSTTSSRRSMTLLSAAQSPTPTPGQGNGGTIPFYEDIKVLPLVKTTWNQSDKNSYSKYTPNNYPCGCVATAYAQLLRYHSYPVSRNFESVQRLCSVDGVSETLSTIGGVYEWDKMPYDVDGITEEQGSAIGKLCYDIGVLQGASFESDGTAMLMTSSLLTDYFGYANAREAYGTFEGEQLMSVISGNLDAGYPVMLSFRESSENIPGHCAIADGYSVIYTTSESVTLTHMNMGWGGNEDHWYCLPTVLSYNIVDGILYNIFPEGAEDAIVNGRVLDSNGEPILCASVKISYQGKTHDVQVDSTGSWVKRVPSGVLISVVATYGENSVSKSISVDSSLGVSNNDIAFSNVTYTRRTLYVDAQSGSDTNNGMSWSSAFKSLSCAVDEAQTGDMVIVASGTYTAINSKGKAIEIRSVDGAENTIITGEGVQRGAILGVKNGDVKTVLNGFTICDGISPNGPSAYRYNGGGVLFGTLKNCIVKNCEALECGGGVYGSILENCHVVSNSAKYGGGVADSVIRKCRISSNNATVSGGAGFWTDDCCFRLENSCYAGNYVLIGNSVIYDNTSKDGITVCGTERYYVSPKDFKICTIPQVVNCTISGIVKLMSICNSVAKIDENLTYGSWFAVGYNMLYDENMFKDASKGDFRISSEGFKLVNAGNTARAKEMPGADDFLGNDRFIGAAVDIGAIEYQSEKDWHVEYIMDGVSLSYCGRNTNIIFPSEFDGLPVRKVGINNDAARECVRSVIIPNGVKEISPEAFSGSQIQNIKIPDSVTSIGDYAFYRCSGLTSVTIPNGVTSIGDDAFAYCSGLTSITIPNSVTSIGEDVFLGCDSLTSTSVPEYVLDKGVRSIFGIKKHVGFLPDIAITHVVINDGVTNIGNEAFYGCYSLISITIPNSVTNIGVRAFYSCDSLTSVTIPNSVTSIGFASFADCSGLTSVTIPDSVSIIGALAFNGCTSLESVHITDIKNWIAINFGDVKSNPLNINEKKANLYLNGQLFVFEELILPDTVTRIGDYAFYDCDWLTSVTIPDSVTSIGNYAFYGCSGLTSVTIPNGVTSIGDSAFYNCNGLTSVTIPDSVTSIGDSAFYRCSGLTSVTIPNGVTSIGEHAFDYCSGLTSITIPNSVTNIRYDAFHACDNIKAVTVGQYICSNGLDVFSSYKSITEVVILDGVTSIGSGAFQNCSGLTSVTIPDSVTSIGGSAFYNCDNIKSVTVGQYICSDGLGIFPSYQSITNVVIFDGVTSIGSGAFRNCSGLTSATIPDSVTSIGGGAFLGCSDSLFDTKTIAGLKLVDGWVVEYTDSCPSVLDLKGVRGIGGSAFYNCSDLTSVTIGDSLTRIGGSAFRGCSGLTSVTIGNRVMSIGYEAFYGCYSLTSVTIPDSVTSIGGSAFRGCSGLTSVTIGNSVMSIGDYAFYDCYSLTSVTIPDSVTSIGGFAFLDCSGLTSVTIGNSVMSIGDYAFYDCYSLTSVTIPDSVTSIGGSAFLDCNGLTSVTIGKGVTSIGGDAFRGCGGVTKFIVDSNNPNYKSVNGLLLSKDGKILIAGVNGDVVIPDGVTNIGRGAFYYCNGLASVKIGKSVTSIGDAAFWGCGGVTKFIVDSNNPNYKSVNGLLLSKDGKILIAGVNGDVVIPDSVTSIGSYAFSYCNGLTSVTIPNSVTSIGSYAFSYCNGLTSVTIPNSVTSIGNNAFYGCNNINSVTVGQYICSEGLDVFSSYKSITKVVVLDGVTSIGEGAFSYCSGLTSITIPNSVTSIGNNAFYGCNNINSVTVGQYICSDGLDVFPSYKSITKVVILDGVTRIGWGAFSGCISLTRVTIPNSVTSIGEDAFYNCIGLTSLTIPNSVTSIGEDAFYNCKGLISVTIGNSVTRIGGGAFAYCRGLTSVTIPNSVTSIGVSAFSGCGNIKSVTVGQYICSNGLDVFPSYKSITKVVILDGVTSIGDRAFSSCSSLTQIIVDSNNPNYKSVNGLLLSRDGKILIAGVNGDVVIPDSVMSIGMSSFYDCIGLTSVTIPNGVTSIGDYAFAENTALTNITFLGDAPSVEATAFNNLTANCTVYVSLFSSGWDVDIPGEWNGLSIRYFNHAVTFDLGEHGVRVGGGELEQIVDNGSAAVEPIIEIEDGWVFNGWSASFSNITKSLTINALYKRKPVVIDGVSWTYDIVNDAVTIGNGKESAVANTTTGILKMPSSINGYPVRSIGANAFRGCSGLTSVTIPDSVTSIGDDSFSGCRGLTSVTIGNSVTSIGVTAFYNCDNIKSVAVGQYICSNGLSIFPSYQSITNVVIFDGVTSIGDYAFYDCYSLTSVTIPDSVTSIGEHAFAYCSGLTSVTIPNSVTSIGDYAFYCCSGLTSVTIPNSVTSIGDCAFYRCSGLTSVTIPNSVTSIGDYAFIGCSGLTSVTIPDSVTSIGDCAFYANASLTNITFLGDAPSVEAATFKNLPASCTVYVSSFSSGWNVDIPGEWKGLPIRYFNHAVSFDLGEHGVRVGGGELEQIVDNGAAAVEPTIALEEGWEFTGWSASFFNITKSLTIKALYKRKPVVIDGVAWTYDIVNDAVTIGNGKDSAVANTTTGILKMPSSINGYPVRSIGANAFCGCSGLTGITIPDSVTSIGNYSFANCGNLKNINLPSNLTSIGGLCFSGCTKLDRIEIPASVIEIRSLAFDKCTSLTNVTFMGNAPTVKGSYIASGHPALTVWVSRLSSGWNVDIPGIWKGAPIRYSKHYVTFLLGDRGVRTGGGELSQLVNDGEHAVLPEVQAVEGWIFDGWIFDGWKWDASTPVTDNMEFVAVYVTPVVSINGREFGTIHEALDFAIDGQTIKLLTDIDLEMPIEIFDDKNIAIDLNGRKLLMTNGYDICIFNERGDLTIDDSVGGGCVVGDVVSVGGFIWLKNGRYEGLVHAADSMGGEMLVTGGMFKYPVEEWYLGDGLMCAPTDDDMFVIKEYVELPPSREFEIDAVEWVKPLTVTIGEKIRFNYDLSEIDEYNWGMCEGASYCAIVCDSDGNVLSELKYDTVPNVGYFDWTVSADCPEHCLVGVIPVELWRELEVNPIEIINGFDVTVQRNDLEEDESDIEIEKILITDGFITNQSVVLRMGIDLKNKELAIKCRDFLLKLGSVYSEYAMSSDLTKWIANDSTLVDNVTIEAGKIYLTMTVSFQELSLAQLKRQLRLIRGVVKINGVPITTSNTVRVDYSSNTVVVNNPIETYTVTFVLGIGTRIGGGELVQTVEAGNSAIEPMIADGPFDGWCFTGWDRDDWQCVNEDITVNAIYEDVQYVPIRHFVLFDIGIHGNHINGPLEQYVLDGGYATVPEIEAHEGWTFAGWSRNVDEPICGATTFVALYEQINTALPVLGDDATSADVKLVLEGAIDENLSNIVDVVTYNSFRMWADKVKNSTGTSAGASGVKVSPNAWLSFALDTDALITAAPKEGDLTIGGFTQGSLAGVVDLSVSISGIAVGDNATAANLEKVFGVEGAGSLDEGEFKEENVDIEFDNPEGGKVKIKATPKNSAAKQFFFRVKMK